MAADRKLGFPHADALLLTCRHAGLEIFNPAGAMNPKRRAPAVTEAPSNPFTPNRNLAGQSIVVALDEALERRHEEACLRVARWFAVTGWRLSDEAFDDVLDEFPDLTDEDRAEVRARHALKDAA
jgi:hypothetical protein